MDGLLVGRFQPFHLGHLEAIRFALGMVDRLWVGIGSSNRSSEATNPFTADERRVMILSSMDQDMTDRISTYEIPDVDNHSRWLDLIDSIVPPFGAVFTNDPLTAHLYSRKRQDIRIIKIPFHRRHELSGTNIRSLIRANKEDEWQLLVPPGTRTFLIKCDACRRLQEKV